MNDVADPLRPPTKARRQADRLLDKRADRSQQMHRLSAKIEQHASYLEVAEKVTDALELLSDQLFHQLLRIVEEKLTIALQEILEQPIRFRAKSEFKRNAANVDFWIERDGNRENVLDGQGGSVANILSVGLRMFALATLDDKQHRRFLVLDEQDCWLRPELVPRLVKIVHDAGAELGFQVLLISHHDVSLFDQYADRIYQLAPQPDGSVSVRQFQPAPDAPDKVE
jgi:hypothetical protein